MPYHCASCADKLGIRPVAPTSSFLASQFQRDKWIKHTVSSSSWPVQSVFDESDEEYYRATVIEAYEHGAVDINSRGTDLVFCPSVHSSIGYKQRYGRDPTPQDVVRVVK